MIEDFNKNDKQLFFNEIKGTLFEKIDGECWCSITLNVGHENPRLVNISVKKKEFDKLNEKFKLSDKIVVCYYLVSRFKNDRYHTTAYLLQVNLIH